MFRNLINIFRVCTQNLDGTAQSYFDKFRVDQTLMVYCKYSYSFIKRLEAIKVIAATRLDRVTSGLWAPRATSCAMLLDGSAFHITSFVKLQTEWVVQCVVFHMLPQASLSR